MKSNVLNAHNIQHLNQIKMTKINLN